MKFNTYKSLAVAFVSMLSVGCTNLEPNTDFQVTQEKYYAEQRKSILEDPTKLSALSLPAYSSLFQFMGERNIYALTEGSTDEMMTPTRGNDWSDNGLWLQLHKQEWGADHLIVENGWNDMSVGISRTFNTLKDIYDIGDGDEYFLEIAQPYLAEVRFLRAYYVWQVLDLFGQVPYRNEDGVNVALDRVTATNLVIQELEEITPLLFEKKDQPEYGKVVRETGHALLSKVYLNRFIYNGESSASKEDMDKAIEHADAVLNSPSYRLADDYFQLFDFNNQDSPEALLIIRNGYNVSSEFSGQTRALMTLHYSQTGGTAALQPWNGMCTTEEFFNSWDQDGINGNGVETTDYRFQDTRYLQSTGLNLGLLEGQQYSTSGVQLKDRNGNLLAYTAEIADISNAQEFEGVRVLKWAPDQLSENFWRANNDVALLRFADVYLMKAEALWRNGDAAGALTIINDLRLRRGNTVLSSIGVDGQEILDERGFELYWEGYRRTDLVRFGQFTKGTWAGKDVTTEDRNIYPIPSSVLVSSDGFSQNSGY
ncbi:RagB/SusD family nutrient uptake outer membrane protein [Flammeovirga pectinis]|uniref:RagB/SusD family nutrient uptake outer membrane protein n=1 Tax=Flammeovirga pectinis TaxID=2494373 RepID=A0A3S9PA01_9BACT|nr:RagB/SusD family nutrient uptake outer membrane protein [Flammeovirga pectinis]AZQ65030.1 RagB/SusD family nutrient uptake outer membrane protein [Flammeovirga pectinis]